MIFQNHDVYESHTVTYTHGPIGKAELYDTRHNTLCRDESAFAFDMACGYRSESWNYPKRLAEMLGAGMPNHPVLHAPCWVERADPPRKAFVLGVSQVGSAVPFPVEGTPAVAVKCVAQMIRSLAGMHLLGLAHGQIGPSGWRMAAPGSLVLVDFGLVSPTGGEMTPSDDGRSLMEKDVRNLADLGLEFLRRAKLETNSGVWRILQSASCQGFGGGFLSARLLFDAFADAAAPVVRVDRADAPADPLRLSPEEVRYLVREFTRQSLAAVQMTPPAQLR